LFPNWADIKFIQPMNGHRFREQLGYQSDDFVMMYAGNMGEKQGLELIVEAARQLKAHSNVKFVMIGAGVAKARLEAYAAANELTNVQFLPVQPYADLPYMLAAADLHLIMQKSQASDIVMPSKLTSILAAGRPV